MGNKVTTIKQAAFAELHGVSRKTVTAWKQRGWLVMQDELVDVDASNARLKKYRAAGVDGVTSVQGNKRTGNKSAVTAKLGETAEDAAERILAKTGAIWDMDEAKRVKENYLALLNQLEYDQASGLVVSVDDIAKAVGTEYAKVRTRLLAIPAEQAPRLQRLKTVPEVQDALQEIITEALEELVRDGVSK